ncbi:hypothetical protein DFP72DRAFT_1116504 [Ephemerocybe angulata]|uniref:DUF6534 domain-containing protein n=1 Tax=Ephemerocybe angulata TaxID=980116 RepID=A0A8H6M688_9AGAR|nr:hypothetical protein DFP72DRAFT_1116504 [Tulosesus angulatus]
MAVKLYFRPTYANQTGAQLIAALVNCVFFGIALYFRRNAKGDPVYLRLLILLMIVLATLQTIFVNHQFYRDTISKHGAPASVLGLIEPSLPGKFLCILLRYEDLGLDQERSASGPPGDCTYRRTCYHTTWIGELQASDVGRDFGYEDIVHIEATAKTFVRLSDYVDPVASIVQAAATAAGDAIITFTLIYVYQMHRSGSQKTNSVIDRLVIYAINRAAATSICAILNVVFFIRVNGTYYFLVPALMTSQLYVISAVSILTSRESLREDVDSALGAKKENGSVTKVETKGYTESEKSL